jgi:hypothetical protein
VFLLIFPLISFDQSAFHKKIKVKKEVKVESELKAVSKELEEKLNRLEEEREKLEELKRVEPKKRRGFYRFSEADCYLRCGDPSEPKGNQISSYFVCYGFPKGSTGFSDNGS